MDKMDKGECSSGNCPAEGSGISRRKFLGRAWLAVAGLLAIEATGGFVSSLWPKAKAKKISEGGFGGKINIATVEELKAMPVGTITYFREARLYISHVESGYLAMYRKCTHLGCVVPWLPDEGSEDDLATKGRFNCPCHAGIYDRYGLVHGGPPPRPFDLFPATIEGGELIVDTGTIIRRSDFDESQVIKV